MNNNTKIAIGIILVAGLFSAPLLIQNGNGTTAVDTNVLIGFDSWQDDNITDGKALMVIRVFSAPTYSYSGLSDEYYVDKVSVDASKPNRFDERIVTSVKIRESAKGRNVTNITWNTQKKIYP